MEKNKKFLIIVFVVIALLVLVGIIIAILESQGVMFGEKRTVEEQGLGIELKASLDLVGAGQMWFLFFEDSNVNGEFDYVEKMVKNVSVAVRRPGEMAAFITVPAEVNGLVKVNQLPVGKYEISYLNSELEQPYEAGNFIFRRYYQIVEAGKVRFSFLPTEWQEVEVTDAGYQLKVGIREYQPASLLVINDKEKVKLYDPVRVKVLGESQLGSVFKLKQGSLYYFNDKDINRFGIKSRLTNLVADRLFVSNLNKYWLNQNGTGLLYLDNEARWQYESETYGCTSSLKTGEFENLMAAGGAELADMIDNQLVVVARTRTGEPGAYLGVCEGKTNIDFRRFELGALTSLEFLDKGNWFYSNSEGSFFFDLGNEQAIKYTALGSNVRAVISEDKKYIGAVLNGSTIVVDYPAVKQSGVEKHYVLPFSGQVAFSGDEVLITQGKPCQEDGDCGEIVRISLGGSGVWEIKNRIELKDIQVDELLGEVR